MKNKKRVVTSVLISSFIFIIILLIGYLIYNNINKNIDNEPIFSKEIFTNKVTNILSNVNNTNNIDLGLKNIMNETEYQNALKEKNINNISIAVKEETITKTGATFIITDKNTIPYMFSTEYRIDRKILGIWLPVKTVKNETIIPSVGITVADGKAEWKKDWSEIYGELKSGKYRLAQKVNDNKYIYAEFTIK